ncbi:YciI family protein [Arthrobacter sp.]|uniref:YciI family protein n=1 Tax=Arthrobacter sp. TaxID=1667 RepID=UPI0028A04BBB|nr:YciI family protein [Arthrobacter sp.]
MSIFAVEYVYDAESAEARAEQRPAHREWLAALVEEGRVLASGPFTDGAGALLIFTAEDEDDLNSLLKQDPLALGGGITGLKTTQWEPVTGAFAHLAS